MKKPLKIAVLGSGFGTSFRSLMTCNKREASLFHVGLVISNTLNAGILEFSKQSQYETICLPSKGMSRERYDHALNNTLVRYEIELVVLVGYMRILSSVFTQTWQGKIINVHPSLLPKHKGLMDLAVHKSVLDNHEARSGCTVHYVTEDIDAGPVLEQLSCDVKENDSPETLKARVQKLEGQALYNAIETIEKNR